MLKDKSKIRPFFERLLEAVGSHLGKLLGCLEALLGGLVFQTPGKKQVQCISQKSCVIAILDVLDCFQGQSWLMLGFLGFQNGDRNSLRIGPTRWTLFDNLFDHFWDNFGGHFGGQHRLNRGPKMGTVLEPSSSGTQGSGRSQNGK